MTNQDYRGFQEAAAGYSEQQDPRELVGQWRRFGPFGPRYEVLSIDNERDVTIRVHTSGEVTKYSITEVLADPVD